MRERGRHLQLDQLGEVMASRYAPTSSTRCIATSNSELLTESHAEVTRQICNDIRLVAAYLFRTLREA
jgi:hypothetical protein